MTLKVYKNKSYKDYTQQSKTRRTDKDLDSKKQSIPQSQFRLFLSHNKFFVLAVILLGTSCVLIGHLLVVIADNHTQNNATLTVPEEVTVPANQKIEIIELPYYGEAKSNDTVWECVDGSFVTSPTNPGECSKVEPDEAVKGKGNKFITPKSDFSD